MKTMNGRLLSILLALLVLPACERNGNHVWSDIDYSRAAAKHGRWDNDSGYREPSVISCVDDDLYNCK